MLLSYIFYDTINQIKMEYLGKQRCFVRRNKASFLMKKEGYLLDAFV